MPPDPTALLGLPESSSSEPPTFRSKSSAGSAFRAQRKSKKNWSCLVAGLAAITVLGVAVPGAEAKPRFSMKAPPAAAAGKPIRFVYTTRGLHRGQRVVVQRRGGKGRPWHTALRLSRKKSASAKAAGLRRGKYRLRIAAVGPSGKVVAQQQRALKVYGSVPLSDPRQEQERYALETMDLHYPEYVARANDFRNQGCEKPPADRKPGECHKPPPYDAFDWTTDGCSWTPPPARIVFNRPCQLHDFGYRNFGKGLTLGRDEDTRNWIDNRFRDEMYRICRDPRASLPLGGYDACRGVALAMWGVVRHGSDWSKPLGGQAPSPKPTPPKPQPQPRTWSEQQGSLGANTFTNPHNASGMGTKIAPYQWVNVSCKIHAPQIVSANPDGYWYRIASPPWSNAYYAVANTFWNGDVPGQKPYTHNTDWAVPDC